MKKIIENNGIEVSVIDTSLGDPDEEIANRIFKTSGMLIAGYLKFLLDCGFLTYLLLPLEVRESH